MSAWQVFRHKYGEKRFSLVGMGMTLVGEVWRGAMKDDIYFGIKGLEHPQARQRVLNNWRVVRRRKIDGVSVEEAGRLVFLESPRSAQVVLRFSQTVPSELLAALREAFEGPIRKEPEREEHDSEAQLDPPLPPGGYRPGLDEDPAREAAEARQHPGDQGLARKRKVKPKRRERGRT